MKIYRHKKNKVEESHPNEFHKMPHTKKSSGKKNKQLWIYNN